jgi:inner membrane transporter RhtA
MPHATPFLDRLRPSRPARRTLLAVAALVLAIATVQSGAALAKGLFTAAGPAGVTALRTGFAAVMLGLAWQPWREPLSARQVKLLLAYGASLGLMNLLFYLSLQRLPLGIAVAIELVGPLSLALLHSRRKTHLAWLALAGIGLASLLPIGAVSNPLDPLGVLLAAGAGTSWALYIQFGHHLAGAMPAARASALGMAVAAILTLPAGILQGGRMLLTPTVLLPGLAIALLSSAIPYSLEMIALKRLPPRVFGVLMSLEPAGAALSGALFLGEGLTLRQGLAIACIILASAGSTTR